MHGVGVLLLVHGVGVLLLVHGVGVLLLVHRSAAFDALLLSNVLWSAGAAVVLVHVPGYALHTGLGRDDAVMLLGVIGVTNFVSRVVFQLFSHSAKLDTTSNFLCSAGPYVCLPFCLSFCLFVCRYWPLVCLQRSTLTARLWLLAIRHTQM